MSARIEWYDAHTHRNRPDGHAILDLDWDGTGEIDIPPDGQLFSIGIHPARSPRTNDWRFPENLTGHPRCVAIGECGLDRRLDSPLPEQIRLFLTQAEFAESKGKPLIIHVVRAMPELLHIKKDLDANAPWLIHGFRGNEAKAMSCIEAGCILSFGEGLLRDNGLLRPFFAKLPSDRILIERDESEIDLSVLYAAAAELAHENVAVFAEQIAANFKRVFQ